MVMTYSPYKKKCSRRIFMNFYSLYVYSSCTITDFPRIRRRLYAKSAITTWFGSVFFLAYSETTLHKENYSKSL
jgi:hypothetical protein